MNIKIENNKDMRMKKLFMLLIAAVSTITTAWGQIGTYTQGENSVAITADASTLTIIVSGDASLIGANWQFAKTENLYKGASEPYSAVNNGESWSSTESYKLRSLDRHEYTAIPDFESTYVIEHQDYTKTFNANAATNLYFNNPWVDNNYTLVEESATPNFQKIWPNDVEGSYYSTRSGEEGNYTYTRLRVEEWDNETYVSSIPEGDPYKMLNNIPSGVYYSANGTDGWEAVYNTNRFNETGVYATRSEVYVYSDPLTFDQLKADAYIKNNAYILEKIRTAINEGEYSTIVVRGGLIDANLIKELTHPGGEANTKLTTLDLGATTTTSFDNAFNQTTLTSLESVTLPMAVKDGDDMVLPGNIFGTGYTWITHNLRTVTIPEGYTKIGDSALKDQSAITTVNLPNSLIEIGNDAMYGMTKLNDVELPKKLEVIGERAFKNCVALSDPVFPASLRKIMGEAYCQIDNIKNLKFNDGLEFIGNSAFYCNHKVVGNQETLQVPATVEYIGPGALTGRWYKDVYFYSEYAPLCPLGKATASGYYTSAFDDNIHMGNNGFTPFGLTVGDVLTESNADDIMNGYANRDNYINHDYYLCMLHFPTEEDNANGRADDKAKTYTDITRLYVNVRNADGTFYKEQKIPVGSEASCLSYDNGQTWSSTLTREVTTGYEDTYKGKQYIWPSQSQWMRSFVNNSLGLEWDGVTEYRPTLTPEMIDLMIEDKLIIKANGSDVTISTVEDTFTFDDASAAAYNETLPGAIKAGSAKTTWTEEDADAHNATLDGHIEAGQTLYYTQAEINEHNAKLDGAISTSDIKTPAEAGHDAVYYSMDELEWVSGTSYVRNTLTYHEAQAEVIYDKWTDYAAANGVSTDGLVSDWFGETQFIDAYQKYVNKENGWYFPGTYVKSPAKEAYYEVTASSIQASTADIKIPAVEAHDDIYYLEDEVNTYNATLPNAWSSPKEKGVATAETAAAYNATLPGAVREGDGKDFYSADEAKDANAGLPGAKKAGDVSSSASAYSDELSKIAYLGTRQFVFADGDHAPSHDYILEGLEPGKWWTICVPFNMTKKMIDDVFGEDTHVCLFSAVERSMEPENKHLYLKFQHDVYAHKTVKDEYGYATNWSKETAATEDDDIVIYAHESYMIFPKAVPDGSIDAVNYVIPFPEVLTGSPIPTIINASDIMTLDDEIDYSQYRFIGNYSTYLPVLEGGVVVTKPTKVPTYSYMYAKKKTDTAYKFWFYTGNTTAWKPNKSLVQNTGTGRGGGLADLNNFFTGSTEAQAKQVSYFGMADEEITAVEDIVIIAGEGEDATTLVYGVNGQLVDMNSIKAGNIYIKNGKKFLAQ